MKILKNIKSQIVLGAIVTCSLLSQSTFAEKQKGEKDAVFETYCKTVKLTDAQLAMIPPIGPASGPAYFIVGGEWSPATATVELLGPPQLQEDSTRQILVKLQYDFGGGDVLFAFARAVLTETDKLGVFQNNALINYIGGTGRYEKAYGRFDGIGTLNFAEFKVQMAGMGEVCNIPIQ